MAFEAANNWAKDNNVMPKLISVEVSSDKSEAIQGEVGKEYPERGLVEVPPRPDEPSRPDSGSSPSGIGGSNER